MKKKVISTALALALIGGAAFAPVSAQAKTGAICGAACVEMRAAGPERLVPTSIKLVCIYFEQRQPGPVVLTVFGSGGTVLRRISKVAGTTGRYCIGKQSYMVSATRVELCNQDDTRAAFGGTLDELIRRGRTPENAPVRLVPDQAS